MEQRAFAMGKQDPLWLGLLKKIRNETQGPHVFFFTLLVMLGTMNLLALLP